MKLRVMTLAFDPELGRFDDEPLQQFLADKELLSLRNHFFDHQGLPYLALVLAYRSVIAPAKPENSTDKKASRDAWRDLLEPADWPLFNTLREWRGQKAKDEGIPPYVICTNRQLAQIVCARPRTLSKLGEIEGFGSAKLKKFGTEIISQLPRTAESSPPPTEKVPAKDDPED